MDYEYDDYWDIDEEDSDADDTETESEYDSDDGYDYPGQSDGDGYDSDDVPYRGDTVAATCVDCYRPCYVSPNYHGHLPKCNRCR